MKRTGARSILLVGAAVGLAAVVARGAAAQEPTRPRRWELRGPQFDFSPDGVWRRRVREVVRARALAMARGDFRALNAPVQAGAPLLSALAVTGNLIVPAVLMRFRDTDTTVLNDTTAYNRYLFGQAPPVGRPYTIRTFYEQMSAGVFSMQGAAVGWVTLSQAEVNYTGPAGGCPSNTLTGHNCNGVWSGAAFAALQAGLTEAIAKADSQGVDWSRFGYDPSTGVLDLVIFIQPNRDGACVTSTNNHIWSHRSSLPSVATATTWPDHAPQKLRVADYTIQAGVGGLTACDTTQIMAIGTAAHETGHGLDLPDLYDTDPTDGDDSEGIGEWGLMGSGNYARPAFPAFFEAWSRQFVGWVSVQPISTPGTYTLNPVESVGNPVYLIRPTGSNPRGEYFLLENRQPLDSDSGTILKGKAPGLLVWHIDSLQVRNGGFANTVNSGSVHGVVLTEADGRNNLLSSVAGVYNRGDAGDPFPGSTGRTFLGPGPAFPRTDLNAGVSAGFLLDSIRQVSAGGPMSFRVRFGGQTVVSATDTVAKVRIRGTPVGRYQAFTSSGDTATISMDSLQTNIDGTVQYRFVSWSDGGARTHLVTTRGRDTTILATTVDYVAAPLDSVVTQLLGGHGLTPPQVLLLDSRGNGNGRFDLGDFVAWLDQSGTAVSAQVLARVFERARR